MSKENKTFFYRSGEKQRYNNYSSYIRQNFGGRVQKVSVNVGFSCPNRDGSKGRGGCSYCDNDTFKPGYCEPKESVSEQLERGIKFFETKYPEMSYMAYFQSYTNTYAEIETLRKMYEEAINHRKIKGLIIGTRPDCINGEILEMLLEVSKNKYLNIELGLESTLNRTLERVNRCHTWEDSLKAIKLCSTKGIKVSGHLILGLPGESQEDILHHAKEVSKLPLHTIKLHQLQIIKNTPLAYQYLKNKEDIKLFTFEEYVKTVIQFLEYLNPKIIVERFVSTSPVEKLIAPKWNKIKNFEVVAFIEKTLSELDTWQGKKFNEK